jgi:DNA/RNA-binding domain of Phe-tRNA-synthetase-like protein
VASAELAGALDQAIVRSKARGEIEVLTGPVRDMLRHGKYKPTGRGKPASEYLHRSALEDKFPRINTLVDINNLVSLESLLPISLVDLVRAERSAFVVRCGRAGESYVFNSAGQAIELLDLLLVAKLPEDVACANPVKDSMATKLTESSSDVMAVLYAPRSLATELAAATKKFEEALNAWGDAKKTAAAVIA